MINEKITYTDFFDVERTEEFFFHMSDHEIAKFISTEGGYTIDKLMDRLVRDRNVKGLLKVIEELLDRSYGIPSPDGRRFEKSEQILQEFKQTEAYSQFYMDLISEENKVIDFIRGIMSKKTLQKLNETVAKDPALSAIISGTSAPEANNGIVDVVPSAAIKQV